MGERKGVNKYYPPDFDPEKHKSLNGYHGTHALRERAKKIDKGIIIIRFEMPYNIWCEGCGIHIAMGVRYNSEKTKVGMYYTTPIFKFRMKCHFCDTYFEIQTDPQNCDYVILSGARRKEQRWDAAENEQIVTDDRSKIKKLATDPMFKLAHGTDDKGKIKRALPALAEIADIQEQFKDDYMTNKLARKKFRMEKKSIQSQQMTDQKLLEKSSLGISLVKEHEEDKKLAHLLTYKTSNSFDDVQRIKRESVEQSSIFAKDSARVVAAVSWTNLENESSKTKSNRGLKQTDYGIKLSSKSNKRQGMNDVDSWDNSGKKVRHSPTNSLCKDTSCFSTDEKVLKSPGALIAITQYSSSENESS